MDQKVEINELPVASNINNSDKFIVEQSGITKQLDFSIVRALIGNGDIFPGTFDNGDLTSGVFTINHNLLTTNTLLIIFNPDGYQVNYPWKNVDNSNTIVDFGGSIDAGAWSFMIVYWNSGASLASGILHTKIDIGDWNMNSTLGIAIAHGIDASKIISVEAFIRNDYNYPVHNLSGSISDLGAFTYGAIGWDETYVNLNIQSGSFFNTYAAYSSLSFNRGYILIHHNA